MKKFLLVFLVLALAMTSVFTGCQPVAEGEKNSANPDSLDATPTPDREKSIYIWWSQDAADLTLLSDAWYDFRDLHIVGGDHKYPEETTLFSMAGNGDGTTQLEQQIMGGTAPDIVRMDHVYITALGQKGEVYDLQAEFGATDEWKDKFITSTWEASSSFDAVYGIPFDANTIIFGAKTSILEQAGVSIPTTYNELVSYGQQIKALNLPQNVYTLPCGTDGRYNWPAFVFMFWVWRLGGDVLNEDYTEAIFNDPETGVTALNMMLDLQRDGLISATAYEEGQTVMCDYGTWWMNGLEGMTLSLQPELKEGVPRYSGLGLYDLAIVTDAKNPQLAYDFAIHFTTGQSLSDGQYYLYKYCINHSFVPSYRPAAEADETWFSDSKGNQSEFWKISVEQLELSKYRPPVPCWPEIEEALSNAVTEAIQGQKAPIEALNSAAATANRLLSEWHNTRNKG